MTMPAKKLGIRLESAEGPAKSLWPYGDTATFDNELFEGKVWWGHRPPVGSAIPFPYHQMLDSRANPPPLWELQVQGRFKVVPNGTLFFAGEMQDKPLLLGMFTRAFLKVALRWVARQARDRGTELRYSLGSKTESPIIAFPMRGFDRIFCTDEPMELPIRGTGDKRKGAWKWRGGEWVETRKSSLTFGPGSGYMTFVFGTKMVDGRIWAASDVPGVGTLDLTRVLDTQPAHVLVFDEVAGARRLFLELIIGPEEGRDLDSTDAPSGVTDVDKDEDDSCASGVGHDEGGRSLQPHSRTAEDETEDAASSLRQDDSAGKLGGDGKLPGRMPAMRPRVGDIVRASGCRVGKLVVDDGSELPFKVRFFDGQIPYADWFKATDVASEPHLAGTSDRERLCMPYPESTSQGSEHEDCRPIHGPHRRSRRQLPGQDGEQEQQEQQEQPQQQQREEDEQQQQSQQQRQQPHPSPQHRDQFFESEASLPLTPVKKRQQHHHHQQQRQQPQQQQHHHRRRQLQRLPSGLPHEPFHEAPSTSSAPTLKGRIARFTSTIFSPSAPSTWQSSRESWMAACFCRECS